MQGSSAPVIKTSLDKETGSGADAARSALTDDVASSQQQQASEAESSADAQEVRIKFGICSSARTKAGTG